MDKAKIISNLEQEVLLTTTFLRSLPKEKFFSRPFPETWSPAENARHLILSVRPLLMAFSLPGFVLRLLFGKPNRPGRTFDQVVEKYKAKLAAGGRATAPFIPRVENADAEPEILVQQFASAYNRFGRKMAGWPEHQLDQYLLPHPLLGKLTLREMLYFTVYHVAHHRELLITRLTG